MQLRTAKFVLSLYLLIGLIIGIAHGDTAVFPERIVPTNGVCSGVIPVVLRGPRTDAFLASLPDRSEASRYSAFELRRMLDGQHADAGLYMAVWAWEANQWRTAVTLSDYWDTASDIRMDLLRIAFASNLSAEQRQNSSLQNPDSMLSRLQVRINALDSAAISPGERRWLADLLVINNERAAAAQAYRQVAAEVGVHSNPGMVLCSSPTFVPAQARLHARGRDVVWLDLSVEINSAGLVTGERVLLHNANNKVVSPALELIRGYRFRPDLEAGELAAPEPQRVRAVVHGTCSDYANSERAAPDRLRLTCQRYSPIERAFIPFVYGGPETRLKDAMNRARRVDEATRIGGTDQ